MLVAAIIRGIVSAVSMSAKILFANSKPLNPKSFPPKSLPTRLLPPPFVTPVLRSSACHLFARKAVKPSIKVSRM